MSESALILGGGGVAGIAWATGVLFGLHEHGVDLRSADRLIGTSAGSTVAAQILSGVALADLFQRQVDPALQNEELAPHPDVLSLMAKSFPILLKLHDPVERTRRIGHMAVSVKTVDEAARRAVIAGRLPSHQWPATPLTTVAVDTETGETKLFDRHSGVDLVDAVSASCAVPGIWPPVTINGRRYMDGGIRSNDNADLAAGCRRVVIISPLGIGKSQMPGAGLASQIARIEAAGGKTCLIEPDDASASAMGVNPLSPESRGPAGTAGRAQGDTIFASVAAFWNARD
ncbi:MAG: patatin-like phospholipase family protein [Janthinobacterium lividum]